MIQLENEWRSSVRAPLYIQEKNKSARPTAIPQKKLKLFSLTPQAGAQTISSNENTKPEKNDSKSPQGSCQTNGLASKDISFGGIIIFSDIFSFFNPLVSLFLDPERLLETPGHLIEDRFEYFP